MLVEQSLLMNNERMKWIQQERGERELLAAEAEWEQLRTWQERFTELSVRFGGSIVYIPPFTARLYEESLDELLGEGETFVPVIDGIAYRGLKTLVVGQSKAGKSFTLWAKVADAVRAGARVKYLSEEARETVGDKVRTFGLMDYYGDAFRVSRRSHGEVQPLPWNKIVDALVEEVNELKLDVVVVDTLRPWLAVSGDESNSDGIIGPAMDALSAVTEAGAAVVIIHQAPWDKLRARGSTEHHATADLIFGVSGEGYGPRTVKYLGGRLQEVPETQTIRWTAEGGVEDLGKMRHDTASRAADILRDLEVAQGEPLTAEEIAVDVEMTVRTVQRHLVRLEHRGKVARLEGAHTPEGREPDRWVRAELSQGGERRKAPKRQFTPLRQFRTCT
jgi:DNA-binding transcriptional ArsR family regulator